MMIFLYNLQSKVLIIITNVHVFLYSFILIFFLQGGPGIIHYSFNYYGNCLLQTQMVKTEDARAQNCR